MPSKDYASGKPNPLASPSNLADEFQRMYGAGVEPIPVGRIRPDLAQPRRVIPASVRGQWDGSPDGLKAVLGDWHGLVEQALGQALPIEQLIQGMGDGEPELSGDPVVDAYAKLVSLAASIHRDGLKQSIGVVHDRDDYRIVYGERRWVAFVLLSLYVKPERSSGGTYDVIPAVIEPKADVWAQAAENGARAPLNAIGMARQLALLVMDMYPDAWRDGAFQAYEDMLYPGECDRKYYAQVANGNVYRIPKGMGQRVLDVTGLSSIERVRQYRALLSIPDELWMKADEQSWSERAIRDYLDAAAKAVSPALTSQHTVTGVTVSQNTDSAALTGGEGETGKSPALPALTETQINVLWISYEALNDEHDGWYPMGAPGTQGEIAQSPLIRLGYLETSQIARPIDKRLITHIRITPAGIAAYLALRPVADDPASATGKHWGFTNGMAFWKRVEALGIDKATVLEQLQPGAQYLTDLRLTKQYTWERLEMLSPLPVADDPLTMHQLDEDEALADLHDGDADALKPGDLVITAGGLVVEVTDVFGALLSARDVFGKLLTLKAADVTRVDMATLDALAPSQRNDVKYFTSRARTPETDAALSASAPKLSGEARSMLGLLYTLAVDDEGDRTGGWRYVDEPTYNADGRRIGKLARNRDLIAELEAAHLVALADLTLDERAGAGLCVRPTDAGCALLGKPALTMRGGLFTQPRPTPTTTTSERRQAKDGDDGQVSTTLDGEHGTPRGAAGAPLAAGEGGETTTPILAAWEDEALAGVLKFLHGLADDGSTVKLRLQELPRISRADIARYAPVPGSWARYVDQTETLVLELIGQRVKQGVRAYCEHLRDAGKDIEAQWDDED